MKIKGVFVGVLALISLNGCSSINNTTSDVENDMISESNTMVEENNNKRDPSELKSAIRGDEFDFDTIKGDVPDKNFKTGPFTINVYDIRLGYLMPKSKDFLKHLNDKKEKQAIMLTLNIEYSEDKKAFLDFDKITIKTDTGEELKPDLFLSEFRGEYTEKGGNVGDFLYYPKDDIREINELKVHIENPQDENDKKIGDSLDIIIKFNDDGDIESISQ
ncbi:MAG: hypothetical protein ACTIH2_05645 [Anaerococcus sp.]